MSGELEVTCKRNDTVSGAGIVILQVKLHCSEGKYCFEFRLLCFWFSCLLMCLGRYMDPCHPGDLEIRMEFLALSSGPALAVVDIWGSNQQKEILSFSVLPFQIEKHLSRKLCA